MLPGVLPAREHRAVHPPLVCSRRRLTRSNAASERSATLLLQCAHRLLQSHDPRLLLLSARVSLRQHLYGKVVTVCDQIEAAMKQSKQASQSTEEEEENASYVDLDLWMGYFIEVLCYNNPLMSACSRGA